MWVVHIAFEAVAAKESKGFLRKNGEINHADAVLNPHILEDLTIQIIKAITFTLLASLYVR